MTKTIDLSELTTTDLLRLSRDVLSELQRRRILRTANAPAGDYAEYLVAKAYDGELAPNSEKSWDVQCPDGRKLQVKARVTATKPGTQLFSPFRSFDFDAAVLILFDSDDLSVQKAVEMPAALVQQHSSFRPHVNGSVVKTTAVDLADAGVIDVTGRLRVASQDTAPAGPI